MIENTIKRSDYYEKCKHYLSLRKEIDAALNDLVELIHELVEDREQFYEFIDALAVDEQTPTAEKLSAMFDSIVKLNKELKQYEFDEALDEALKDGVGYLFAFIDKVGKTRY